MTEVQSAGSDSARDHAEWLASYRSAGAERQRTDSLFQLLPKAARTALEIGPRDGFHTRLLAQRFEHVTALDLELPDIEHPRVTPLAGDVTSLQFADGSFDCVICAEVLEHVPDLKAACSEISRVTRRTAVIGVPYRQDLRFARTTCTSCGRTNPPWAHLHSFDEAKLTSLFPTLRLAKTELVASIHARTNAAAAWLMDQAGNPWGSYDQDEPCIHCGAVLRPGPRNGLGGRACGYLAARLNDLQGALSRPAARWIHCVFEKP